MDVIDYVLAITALGVFLVPLFLLGKWGVERLWRSVTYADQPPRLWPDGYDESELDAVVGEPPVQQEIDTVITADDGERGQPSPDWSQRAIVILGTGRRLHVVRSHGDLRKVPSLDDAPELGDRCPRGEAVPSGNIMPPEGA